MASNLPWGSPLKGYENAAPLPTTINPDGKSLYNPPGPQSASYGNFPKPIDSSNNGFDFHIYYMPNSEEEMQYARELHERIRREFPELRIYKFWDKPVGPHPVPMFEVNVFTPHQTGAFFSWLVVNRGPCSVLVHPNTGDPYKDHIELATWIGRPFPLLAEMLKRSPR
ncbi:DOPA-like domain-containing protein [Rhodofomes roseus]|uniref:DOPA-like domain-containing protein n=1 Tax=Rhodofomes roseus TaxID=34475 RepID=A0ABQ8KN12_9APHY|nr:DOPA-like domain-containing protein [Rhodofomes roseus]KAH9839809.1 DOPA-like domain-containing protein [Rhodofomes roseus]